MGKLMNDLTAVTKPPVVEAVIEMEFSHGNGTDFTSGLRQIADTFLSDLPDEVGLFENITDAEKLSTQLQRTGFKLSATDSQREISIDISRKGIAVRCVGSYCGGDALINIFERLWGRYTTVLKPRSSELIRMRYINKLVYTPDQISTHLTVPLALPPISGSVKLSSHYSSFEATDNQRLNMVSVNYLFTPSSYNDGIQIELYMDIDAYQRRELISDSWDTIKANLDSVRNFKNMFFSGSFTPTGWSEFCQ